MTLPAFAPMAETTAVAASFTTAPDYRRTYHLNRMMKRLKTYSGGTLWGKIIAMYPLGDTDAGVHMVNIRNPGTFDLTKVGTPTHTPGVGVSTTVGTSYYDTGIPLNSLSQNSVTIGIESATASTSGTSDAGAINGSSNGLGIACQSNFVSARVMGASLTVSPSGYTNGIGFYAVSRNASGTVEGSRDGVNHPAAASTSVDLSATALTLHVLKLNGSSTPSPRTLSFMCVAAGLSEAEKAEIYGAWKTYHRAISQGSALIYDAGIGATTVSADLVVFGATGLGVCAAYEAARQGKSVVIVGGWRERHIGGMSANGLGYTDFITKSGLGGLPKKIIERMKVIGNRVAATDVLFTPRVFNQVMREMLDSTKGGYDIPVYWSDGLASVVKSGARIQSITTVDGRTITGRYFHDASYEGDLLGLAAQFTTGREAAGSGAEAANGWRGLSEVLGAEEHQFRKGATFFNISPYITDGDAGSGLLPGLTAMPAKTIGQADDETQAFNFRQTWTTTGYLKKPFPSTPPAGYSAANYEALGRWFAAGTANGTRITMEDIFNVDLIPGNVFDTNSDGGIGSDRWGSGTAYVNATTMAAREAVWQDVALWIKGLIYYICYDSDARIPAATRTEVLGYGFASDHYLDPEHGDEMFFPFQLYVREHRRLSGMLQWTGNDLVGADGGTPRSTKTVSMASYQMDSHHTEALADEAHVPPRIWNSGNFFASAGGTDNLSPIPYEIITPVKSDCENLNVSFAVSATHVAFGSIRMEFTAMQAAQSAAMAACVAMDAADQALQDVDYPTLRTRLLATPDANPPVLTQVY